MSENRPFVLTIAGFDPSAGAGVLADVKTFEQHHVFGFAINTGNTIQTEDVFYEIQWTDLTFVLKSLNTFFKKYEIKVVKIGVVPSLDYLKENPSLSATLVDLVSLQPWDKETVSAAVKASGRVLILHEDTLSCGFGAEIAACEH